MASNSVLLIYTGGTIGMVKNPEDGALKPFNFDEIHTQVPELRRFNVDIDAIAFDNPIDSSDIKPKIWQQIAKIIEDNYELYSGFVILHGTDTMAYTASALSFMLKGLAKPVIFTGSQLPIGEIRTDARENIITAIELASAASIDLKVVPEVCIYFDYCLYRGNRSSKINTNKFKAFASPKFPALAEAGTRISFHPSAILNPTKEKFSVNYSLEEAILTLKLFPGILQSVYEPILRSNHFKLLILETFGSGNASTDDWFLNAISDLIQKNIPVINVSQCLGGVTQQGRYETSKKLKSCGVIDGLDLTYEAVVTKSMHILPMSNNVKEFKTLFEKNISGETGFFESY